MPFAVHEQPLLRREVQIALLPFATMEYPELLEQLSNQGCARARHGHVMSRPRIGRYIVAARSRIPAGVRRQLADHKVAHPTTFELPGGRQAGDAAADHRD